MKKLVIALVLGVVCTSSVMASQITFGNAEEIVYDWSGGAIAVAELSGYVMRMYLSVDDTINFSAIGGVATNTGDDVWTGVTMDWASAGADGYTGNVVLGSDITYGIDAGEKVYTVIFSQSPTAGYFAVIDNSPWTVSYPAGNASYDAGGVVGGLQGAGGEWQAVPEPATFGLMAIGAGIAWLVRLKQRYC